MVFTASATARPLNQSASKALDMAISLKAQHLRRHRRLDERC
jgi:hypothetical protein